MKTTQNKKQMPSGLEEHTKYLKQGKEPEFNDLWTLKNKPTKDNVYFQSKQQTKIP